MPKKVLVVEDDRSARTGLLQLIAGEGYVALGASTFEEGRQLLRSERPDLLIADVRLGEFNGLQLIIGQEAAPRTIVVTGYADPVLEADARRAGAYYLLKPLDVAKLLTIVHAELEHAEAPQQPQRRWARKPVAGGLTAQIDSTTARVLDISYGGLRLNLSATDNPLPPSFDVKLPEDELSVPVELIWQSRTDDGGLECGVALSTMSHSAMSAWHGLVDAIG
jgi:DNA-binding response OmpR family regulator